MSARIVATARFRSQLRLAGMTYHGAHGVEVLVSASSNGGLVVVPELALVEVAELELPALLRIVVALLEALALLVAIDRQEELDDGRAALGQRPLEGVDLVVALRPDPSRSEAVDADDEHVLVVRAVEDPDLALARRPLVDAPQEVVGQLLRRSAP